MDSYNVSNLIDIESPKINSQLRFQEFGEHSTPQSGDLPDQSNPDISSNQAKYKSFWTLEYYQQFFDVNTDDVVNRIKWSMIPRRINYFQNYIQSKPDLYGPFWISVTLIFTIGISGNLANYLQTAASHKYHWKYDFHTVSSAASAIFLYAWLVPMCLWSYLKWYGSEQDKCSVLEVICTYGYCISIYIPVSILWVIQVNWLQWILVLVGAILSGSVLVTSLSPRFGPQKLLIGAIIAALHILLAMSFMLYFFHVPSEVLDEPGKQLKIEPPVSSKSGIYTSSVN